MRFDKGLLMTILRSAIATKNQEHAKEAFMTNREWQHVLMLGRFDDTHALPATITDHHSAGYAPCGGLPRSRGVMVRSRRGMKGCRRGRGGRNA